MPVIPAAGDLEGLQGQEARSPNRPLQPGTFVEGTAELVVGCPRQTGRPGQEQALGLCRKLQFEPKQAKHVRDELAWEAGP